MRKIYKLAGTICLGLVLTVQNTNAQTVSDFEALTLSTDSFWNGSDLSGTTSPTKFTAEFLSKDAIFTNIWDTTFGAPGYWYKGFAQSTFTDTLTSGPANTYSARTGEGNNTSLTYLVAKNNSKFTFDQTVIGAFDSIVNGIYITNNTYAANSMRDGDMFAKKFGGMTGNDQDWFLLTIKGIDNQGDLTSDSVNFYLADYRFTNNTQDYIVKDWQLVDLTSLGNVTGLTFTLTSSDVGPYGMNTPDFFCLDDISPITGNLIDFEDLGFTTTDSSWNGSDLSGEPNDKTYRTTFTDGDAEFKNVWNKGTPPFGGFWQSGFAYSNKTDSITSGFTNTYSAKATEGVNGSDNYLVAKNNSKIYLTGAAANNTVSGVYITNTTYAANSMRDGDTFGKKFGGSAGTENDWFLLTIKGYTGGSLTTDSVNFYLADYRFTDSAQDYIVKDWQWVDLTSLGTVDSLVFSLSSSDVGTHGINTPTFFALDNFNDQTVTAVNELTETTILYVYPNPAQANITVNLKDKTTLLQVVDVTGKVVKSESNLTPGVHNINLSGLNAGVYFIKIVADNTTQTERFIKQ